jgi:beta-glucan synthesis-associated protein KRE6
MKPFNYQMDAISSNWPLHVAAYTDFLVYQVEWVTGKNGYVRWNLDGHPLFEVTAESFEKVPQDAKKSNPQKLMIEEPMYIIFNVALSTSWGATPPNPGKPCRGDGKDPITNAICDEFPMYMKIDYIRLYQDTAEDLEPDNYMQIGCDPASHPTKEWINGHIDEYQDFDNLAIDVAGGAFCTKNDDCTVRPTGDIQFTKLVTGSCVNRRCVCTTGKSWGGPRCTQVLDETKTADGKKNFSGYGPPLPVAIGLACVVVLLTCVSISMGKRTEHALAATAHALAQKKQIGQQPSPSNSQHGDSQGPVKVNYGQNFV